MKKITLFLFTLIISTINYAQFPEEFTDGIPDTWAVFIGENGQGDIQNWIHNDINGVVTCFFEDVVDESEDWLVSPKVEITTDNQILSFQYTDGDTEDFGTRLQIRISKGNSQTNHSDFETVVEFSEANTGANSLIRVELGLESYIGEDIYIAFVMIQDFGDQLFLDNIDLEEPLEAPDAVTTPTPADNAINVPLYVEDLDKDGVIDQFIITSWTPAETGGTPQFYDFYLGVSDDEVFYQSTIPADGSPLVATGLEYDTTYYWGVVAKNNGGDSEEDVAVWAFTTEGEPLSTNEVEENDFTFFYNQNSEKLHFSSPSLTFKKIEIFNYLGKQFMAKEINSNSESIGLPYLKAGVYLARISIEGETPQTIRFIKQ